MLECRLGKDTKDRYIGIKGDLPELIADLVMLINSIYNALRQYSPEAAETFADAFPQVLEGHKDEIFGPKMLEGVVIGTVVKKEEGGGRCSGSGRSKVGGCGRSGARWRR